MNTHARGNDHPNGGVSRFLPLVAAAVLAGGCGSGGDGTGADAPAPTIDVNARGRVVLGALADATLEVYRIGDYDKILATTTTSNGDDLASIGNFAFTLTDVPADAMFLLVAAGGEAHDKDEEGTLDGPTPNLGKVHALASAAALQGGDVRLSAVTEVVYQRARYFLEARYDDAYVAKVCDAWTSFVLRWSIDGDAAVGSTDALAFDPLLSAPAALRPYAAHFGPFVARLLAGQPLTAAAFDLSREEIRFHDLEGQTFALDLVGNLAFVARGDSGVEVWDVADPTAPTRIGGFDTPGLAYDVQVVGTLAYVADAQSGLQILNVAIPAAPTLARTVPLAGFVTDVHVADGRAYLCGDGVEPTLHIVDVTTPATASLLGTCPLADSSYGVRLSGGFAYLPQYGQVEIVDVSDPTLAASVGAVEANGYIQMDLALGHLFVTSAVQLDVFSLAAPTNPQQVSTLALPGYNGYGIRIRGTRALLLRSFEGLGIADVADPANPVFLGLIPTSGGVADADEEAGLLVVTEANSGLSTVGAGTPVPSGVVATLPRAGSVDAVDAVGNRVYVTTSGPNELVVLDSTNPLAPSVLGAVPLAHHSGEDVLVAGARAFVAEYGGLSVYDVSNSLAPVHQGGDASFGGLRGLALGTDVLYASIGEFVGVYDISDPTTAPLVTHLRINGNTNALVTDGSAVVVPAGSNGSLTLAATTPRAPVPVGQLVMGEALDAVLLPPYAFVTEVSSWGIGDRLVVVDYSNLAAPTSPASVVLPGAVDAVVRSGSHAYVSGRAAGVNVVDLSTPTAPLHVGTIPVPAFVTDLDVEGGFVFVAGGYPRGEVLVLRAAQVAVP